jgi:hypothetical protein
MMVRVGSPMGHTIPHMKRTWLKIGCSDVDLAVLREVANLLGVDVSSTVRLLAREKWRELNKAQPLPVTSKGRRQQSS